MKYREDHELHDSLRAHFQTVDVQHLNASLIENGITDLELRKKILADYFFTAGLFFDGGWFEADGRRWWPVVCFREVSSDLKATDRVVCPDPGWGTIFHEMAHGTTETVADDPEGEDVTVQTGEIED
jgi:hypothetical protein